MGCHTPDLARGVISDKGLLLALRLSHVKNALVVVKNCGPEGAITSVSLLASDCFHTRCCLYSSPEVMIYS